MYCSTCGQELPPEATHCSSCASPVPAVTPQPQYEADMPSPQQPPRPLVPGVCPPGCTTQALYVPAKPTTPLHKVLAVAIIVMGAFLAFSEILFLLYRFTIGIDATTIKFWWVNLCLVGVICGSIFMMLGGLKLWELQKYRRWAGLSAILFGVSGVFDVLYDFVFPAGADVLALQIASFLSIMLWYGLYAGIMFLLWRAPVAWQERTPSLMLSDADQPGRVLGNIVLWAGIFWTARQIFALVRIVASNIQYTSRSGAWTVAIFAAGVLALVCGLQLRAGKQARVCASMSFACFCLYAILIASVYINSAGFEGGRYLLSDMSAVLETFIAPGFMLPFVFFRYKQKPSEVWPQQTF